MSLRAKYKLRTPIAPGTLAFDQLIEGEEASTGRPVSIHILSGGSSPENQSLLREIDNLPREYKIVFLEIGEHEGNPFIVTDALSGAPPFRKWFSSVQAKFGSQGKGASKKDSTDLLKHSAWQIPVQVSAATSAAPKGASPVVPPTSSPGDFTQIFGVADEPRRESIPAVAPSAPVKAMPGEFTQMLQSAAALSSDKTQATAQSSNAVAPFRPETERAQVAGEFTQLFKASDAVPAKTTEPSQNASVADEFSAFFTSPTAPAAEKAVHVEEVRVETAHVKKEALGEFTQLFQTRPASAQHSPLTHSATETPLRPEPGEFTQLFQAPVTAPKPISAAPATQPAPVAKPQDPDATLIFQTTPQPRKSPEPLSSRPGEFTQMFSQPQHPVAPSRSPDRPPTNSAAASFDALFNQSPAGEQSAPASVAPAAIGQPGEFTRMMESPLVRSGLKPQSVVAAPPDRFSMKSESSGFAEMLESPVSPHSDMPSTPVSSRREKASGEATRAFRFPEATPQPPTPAAEPVPPTGPSEFTQMFKAPLKKEEPKPSKHVAKPARVVPRRKPSNAYLKWILAGSAILLIIVLIIFFAVRD